MPQKLSPTKHYPQKHHPSKIRSRQSKYLKNDLNFDSCCAWKIVTVSLGLLYFPSYIYQWHLLANSNKLEHISSLLIKPNFGLPFLFFVGDPILFPRKKQITILDFHGPCLLHVLARDKIDVSNIKIDTEFICFVFGGNSLCEKSHSVTVLVTLYGMFNFRILAARYWVGVFDRSLMLYLCQVIIQGVKILSWKSTTGNFSDNFKMASLNINFEKNDFLKLSVLCSVYFQKLRLTVYLG